jgi:hypothetical protein
LTPDDRVRLHAALVLISDLSFAMTRINLREIATPAELIDKLLELSKLCFDACGKIGAIRQEAERILSREEAKKRREKLD